MWPNKTETAKNVEAGGDPPVEKPADKTAAELIAESLKPVTDGFAAINQRLTEIDERTKPKAPKPPDPSELPSVLDDENNAFNVRLAPIAMRQLELEARMVRDQIEREYTSAGYGELWAQYRTEIESTLANSALVQPDSNGGMKSLRGDPDYIRNVVDMVFGRQARKAGMRFDGKNGGFFLESAGGGAGAAAAAAETAGMSPEQVRVFQRMNVPLVDAKKTLAKLKFVS